MIGDRDTHKFYLKGVKLGGTWKMGKIIGKLYKRLPVKLEKDLWRELKRIKSKISWTRLENRSLLGTPDLLGYNDLGRFFTVELKVNKRLTKYAFHPTKLAFT